MNKLILTIITCLSCVTAHAGIYLIGDFNDWQIPTQESDNGAIKMVRTEPIQGCNTYAAEVDFPKGSHKVTTVTLSDATFKVSTYVSAYVPDFQVTNAAGPNDWPEEAACNLGELHRHPDYIDKIIIKRAAIEKDFEKVTPFNIKDWEGGKITISHLDSGTMIGFHSEDAPTFIPKTDKKTIYLIAQIDGTAPQILELSHTLYNGYWEDYGLRGHEISFFFSSEKSTNPAPENTWGRKEDGIIVADEANGNVKTDLFYELVQGGSPFHYKFPTSGGVLFTSKWMENELWAELFPGSFCDLCWVEIETDGISWKENLEIDPETGFFYPVTVTGKDISVYVKGSHSSNPEVHYDFGPEKCPYENFFTDERYPDYPYDKVRLTFPTGRPYTAKFQTSGTLTVEVSPYYKMAYVRYDGDLLESTGNAGIHEVETSDFADQTHQTPIYFDLMGNRVENPGKGIFLEKRGDTVKKVLLH